MLIKTKYLVCFKLVLSSVYLTNYKSSGGSLSAARRRGQHVAPGPEQKRTERDAEEEKKHQRDTCGNVGAGWEGGGRREEEEGGQSES